jgi:hypothetical protein
MQRTNLYKYDESRHFTAADTEDFEDEWYFASAHHCA